MFISFDNLRRVTYQLLTALYYLNQENVVHRNLSPACILLDKQVKIVTVEFYCHVSQILY
jgi:serine/threonine protein kinase